MRNTMNLQLFADAVRGNKIVYLYRIEKDAAKMQLLHWHSPRKTVGL